MKKSIITGAAVATICATLAATNPEKEDYISFLSSNILAPKDAAKKAKDDSEKTLVKGILYIALENTTERRDFLFFSLYRSNAGLLRVFNPDFPDLKFVGIGDQFIPYWKTYQTIQKIKERQQETTKKSDSEPPPPASPPIKGRDIPAAAAVELEQAVRTVTQEIDGAFTPALLKGLADFESRYKAFDSEEGRAQAATLKAKIQTRLLEMEKR
jgi:hypothetical protein